MTIRERSVTSVALLCLGISISGCTTPSDPSPLPSGQTRTLSGVILEMTPTGALPVEGVRVTLAQSAGQTPVTTDAAGVYSFAGISSTVSQVVLRVEKYGFQSRLDPVRIDGDTRLDIELVRLAIYTLSGVVSELTPTGQVPLAGVEVWGMYHDFTRTDDDGRYEMTVFSGTNVMTLRKEGFRDLDTTTIISGDTRLDLQLVRR